jgi:hypothetical protein
MYFTGIAMMCHFCVILVVISVPFRKRELVKWNEVKILHEFTKWVILLLGWGFGGKKWRTSFDTFFSWMGDATRHPIP